MTREWAPYTVEFHSDLDRPELAVSPWAGHRWFAYDLVRWARPRRIVELGTHYGCSFFAFCQALVDEGSDGEVVAIDTWEGEEHTGLYGEEVFTTFTTILEQRYAGANARLVRSTFDDALPAIEDGSVEVLHIDGLHTYEAVRHDYETWEDKLAPNGIVLFHDVAPSSGYGSARYWQEVKAGLPGFAFLHSFGLGVLLPKGAEGRESLLELGDSPWRAYYQHRAGHDLRSRQVNDLGAMVDARDESLAATTAMVDARDESLAATTAMVEARDEALRQVGKELDQARDALESVHQELSSFQLALSEREEEQSALAVERADLQRKLADAIDDQRASAELEHQLASARAEADQLRHELAAAIDARDAYAANLDLYRRALRPIRWASRPPRRVLRRLRHPAPPAGPRVEGADAGDPPAGAVAPALFDAGWYRAQYPDVGRAGVEPADHWRTYGWKEGRQPCPLFDAGSYLMNYHDVADAGIDPLEHWTNGGWRESRDPSALFSTSYYRSQHGDGSEGQPGTDDDPLRHYLDQGLASGRFISAAHAERVLGGQIQSGPEDELLVEVLVTDEAGRSTSVPLPWVMEVDADLVTFDLWDTLLTRTRPADASKLATARRIRLELGLRPGQRPTTWELMRRRVEIEAEIAGPDHGEYLISDVLGRQLEELAEPGSFDTAELADTLRQAELRDEMASTQPIREVVLLLDKLQGRGDATRVAVLSDFYMSGEDLRDLLAHHGIGDDRLDVISSADIERSKHAGGELFHWARERYGVEAARHLHLGDNPHADVAMQTATGGRAVHLVHGSRVFAGPGQLDERTISATTDQLRNDLAAAAELRCRQEGLRPRPGRRIIQAAWSSAILPVALVAAAVEEAEGRGLDRVHYLSREGVFLSRVHDEVTDILRPGGGPDAVHLAVSRRSTFGPSLSTFTPESLMDLWRMYPHQSLEALLISLGMNPQDLAESAARHRLDPAQVIEAIHLDDRVAGFLSDARVQEEIGRVNGERRRALLDYLASRTDLDREELVVVDVGWRGTVQDNLSRLLPNAHLVGWYLALFPFLNPQPANGEKHALGPDGNEGQDIAFMEPPAAVERPWTPAAPSVIDYRRGPGGVEPILDEEVLDEAGRQDIALFQDAVIEAAPMVARWIVANGAATDVLRPLIADELNRYYADPEPGIADLWFDNAHDDTFGALNVTSFGKDRPGRHWFGEGLGRGFLEHLESAAEASLWPAGYHRWRPVQAAAAVERALRSNGFRDRR